MATSAEYNLGEFAFPRGWFVVADAADITSRPMSVRFFGQDVVIYRGDSGAVAMLEAYCPHMGTHLGRSTQSHTITSGHHVEGDSIRCPFHGWRYGSDGKCNEIPYFDGPIPRLAKVRSWLVQERWGIVFCWNDPEGLEPDFELPDIPEWDDPTWMRWTGLDHLADLPCHPIEVFDNNSDAAHLQYLHGGQVRLYENEVDGHFYRQRESLAAAASAYSASPFEAIDDEVRIATINSYVGPGVNFATFTGLNAREIIATTPIDDGVSRLWQCAMVKRPDGLSDLQAHDLLEYVNEAFAYGLGNQDGEVWAHKRPATTVMQMPTDGPFMVGRTWYRQFFNPRAQAAGIVAPVTGIHYVPGIPAFVDKTLT